MLPDALPIGTRKRRRRIHLVRSRAVDGPWTRRTFEVVDFKRRRVSGRRHRSHCCVVVDASHFLLCQSMCFYPFYKILSIFADKKLTCNVPVVCPSSSSARVARRERVHHGYIVDVRRAVVVQDRCTFATFSCVADRGRVGRRTMRTITTSASSSSSSSSSSIIFRRENLTRMRDDLHRVPRNKIEGAHVPDAVGARAVSRGGRARACY